MEPFVLATYSETGGATKTTSAVSLAMVCAEAGLKTLLIDLDPRGAATKWLDIEPAEPGLHVGAILADEDPVGWASDLAVECSWSPNLLAIPSDRQVSNRERDPGVESHRLRLSLIDVDVDVVVLDCPNRQGGPLIQNAMMAADAAVICAQPSEDGLDGIEGAIESIEAFQAVRGRRAVSPLAIAGIIVGGVRTVVVPRDERRALKFLREEYPEYLLNPVIPQRVIVREARSAKQWFGAFRDGASVVSAYRELAKQIIPAMKEKK